MSRAFLVLVFAKQFLKHWALACVLHGTQELDHTFLIFLVGFLRHGIKLTGVLSHKLELPVPPSFSEPWSSAYGTELMERFQQCFFHDFDRVPSSSTEHELSLLFLALIPCFTSTENLNKTVLLLHFGCVHYWRWKPHQYYFPPVAAQISSLPPVQHIEIYNIYRSRDTIQ